MWVLAIGSYLLNKSMRAFIFLTAVVNRSFSLKQGRTWASGTQKMLNNPYGLFLPCILGPRWNCHALLARLGPFNVKQHIRVDATTLATADSWSVVIYDRKFHTVETFSLDATMSIYECSLATGRYSIFLRYYDEGPDICAPAVYVDGQLLTEATRIKNEKKQYGELLESIKGRKSRFYFLVHFYVFYLLRYQDRFATAWVRNEFLPVGNPDTAFLYGYLPKGTPLNVVCRQELLDHALVFLSTYNEASFPETWTQVQQRRLTLMPNNSAGAYLVRIVSKRHAGGGFKNMEEMVEISFNQ